jgi:hypothetical protein
MTTKNYGMHNQQKDHTTLDEVVAHQRVILIELEFNSVTADA